MYRRNLRNLRRVRLKTAVYAECDACKYVCMYVMLRAGSLRVTVTFECNEKISEYM